MSNYIMYLLYKVASAIIAENSNKTSCYIIKSLLEKIKGLNLLLN